MYFDSVSPRTIIDCIKRRNPFRTPKQIRDGFGAGHDNDRVCWPS